MPDDHQEHLRECAKAADFLEGQYDRTPEFDRLHSGLQAIQNVLDYTTDSSQMRQNIAIWVKNSVDALLRGEEVVEPPRKA